MTATRPATPARDEQGAVGLQTIVAGLLLTVLATTLVAAATDLGVAAARARTAADAAALAAAGASPLAGGDGHARSAAGVLAEANGARLVDCCQAVGSPRSLAVEVVVAVAPRLPVVRAGTGLVRARAAASLRPDGAPADAAVLAVLAGDLPGVSAGDGPGVSAGDGPAGGTGRLLRPVNGHLASGYGWRVHPVFGGRRLHTGADLAAPSGTPILAAESGVVTSARWRGGYGNTVTIDHGGGLATLYAHQSRMSVAAGARVRRGQVIGAVGCTGTCTGPHLHLEVRRAGQPVDPLPYLD